MDVPIRDARGCIDQNNAPRHAPARAPPSSLICQRNSLSTGSEAMVATQTEIRRRAARRQAAATLPQGARGGAASAKSWREHVVLAQPHRRGDADQRCGSAFGRFCKRCAVNTAGETAAPKYEGLVRRWRAARGVPTHAAARPWRDSRRAERSLGARLGARILRYDRAMTRRVSKAWLALKQMLLMDYDIGLDQAPPPSSPSPPSSKPRRPRGRAGPRPNPLPQAGRRGALALLPQGDDDAAHSP